MKNILTLYISIGMLLSLSNLCAQVDSQFNLISSKETGVSFKNTIIDDKEKNILMYANFYGGAGVGVGDFNNDGLEDIYFAGNLVDDKLYLNQGNFKFIDNTAASGIVNNGSWSTGVTIADVNNDGLLDIYVSNELYDHKPELRKNKLYINQGNAVFKELANSYGVDNSERTRHAAFFDYNNDGFLDLFILNQPPNPGSYSEYFGTKLLQDKYTPRLYKNVEGKSFVDVTNLAGLNKAGFPNAVSASDLNNDGYTDLYVSNDFYAPDFMYINNQDGTFTNIANKALNHMSYYSMGVDVADINNDNQLDIFTLDMIAEDNFRLKSNMSGMNPSSFWKVVNEGGHYQYMYNSLHLNNGNNTYSDIAQLTNMAATDWSWANLIADFDNDGKKDVYVTNGLLRDIRNTDASKAVGDFVVESANKWVKDNPNGGEVTLWDILDLNKTLALLPSDPLSNYMFQNKGDYKFNKVATEWGLDQKSFSNGAAYADFDNDGDLDLVVNNINEEAFIYRNNAKNKYLRIVLKSKENKPVFASRVTAKINGESQILETTNVRGIYSTSESVLHFGLGSANNVESLKIIWPNTKVSLFENLPSNQELTVYLEDAITSEEKDLKKQTLVTDITSSERLRHKHHENKFDDYKYQVLLPHKMSQFGPSLAVSDVNNDGLDDVFIGGAAGHVSKLFFQDSVGVFKQSNQEDFLIDMINEDIDATFIDIDNDNDQDLYVVSGGNEYEKGSKNYNDRLYINNGNGKFSKSKNKSPKSRLSGSVVIKSDYDNDGDLDVFIGGRMIPRAYPLPANSQLLENVNGKLIDVTQKIAKDLINVGMVTDAIWSDYDGDDDLDLIVVGEWMPISIFENKSGEFSKVEIPDLRNTEGWWYSIEQGDFDNDGDLDYIAGNLGLNYKYKTSSKAPFDVYYKDFDKNGSNDIVLGYYNYGKHYPLRGFSCSAQQIPTLKNDIKKYDIFASLEIADVYGENKLEEANHFKANTFASSFIENLGNGNFNVKQLPIEVQFSSINDVLVTDINNDKNLDVILVGNLFVSEIETPRNDAGTGTVLLGDGMNNFKVLNHKESGFFNRMDAKKIKVIQNGKDQLIVVGNNNNKLQVFKINK